MNLSPTGTDSSHGTPTVAPGSPRHRRRWRDVAAALGGVGVMGAALATPWRRRARRTWGLARSGEDRTFPGDDLVADPLWLWVHGVLVDAPVEAVWPWVAQIGADRAGFYSYQWLENLAGCGIRNADSIHPEWAVRAGGELLVHPKMPPLLVVEVEDGRWFVAHGSPPVGTDRARDRWVEVSWAFLVDPVSDGRSRVVSRYRCATSNDLPSRRQFGPALLEPISFAMDRRMLRGIKNRAERANAAG